jgi:hypothetical protein
MKNLYPIFLAVFVIFTSCSSDDSTNNNNETPPDNITFTTRPQELYATQWFFDKEVYTLSNGDVIEILPEPCRSESWFEIANNLVTSNNNKFDDGNGNCLIDNSIRDSFYFLFLGGGFFEITHFITSDNTEEENDYEIILENNGINDEPHPKNIMIWIDHEPEDLYQGETLITKKLYFRRKR